VDGPEPRPSLDAVNAWLPRQALRPHAFELNGAVYAFWIDRLSPSSPGLLFGRARAIRTDEPVVDIDDVGDLVLAESLVRRQRTTASTEASGALFGKHRTIR